ncbi:MAG TPA: YCF48-related protein [Flavitalea sp.]|nr:YCF48-related protein [Flavitalea sp.]
MKIYLLLLTCYFFSFTLYSQKIELLTTYGKTSFRGLSVVTDRLLWVSGNNGTVGRSADAGQSWTWFTIPGYEKRDFRDIEAFSFSTAIIIAVSEPAVILKTVDAGKTWKLVYENKKPGMFLDAMEFWNEESGIVLGDPISGRFFISRTYDGGNTWKDISEKNLPGSDSGEACFAASGTNIRKVDKDEACFVSGGKKSRLFLKGKPIDLPIIQGKESTGANSVAVRDSNKRSGSKHLVIVGGDFAADSSSEKNCILTHDGGKTWIVPSNPPHGYRSCVEYIDKEKLIACGTTGIDVSLDGGINWNLIGKESYHVVRKAKKGKSVFLAGGSGKIGKLIL